MSRGVTASWWRARRGFTLIELLVGLAVVAVIATLAVPSFRDMIEMQRLRGTNAQLVTDLQFARSEAVSRQDVVGVTFRNTEPEMTCYVIYACRGTPFGTCSCNCAASEGLRCAAPIQELRTVQLSSDLRVRIDPVSIPSSPSSAATVVRFDPVNGGMAAESMGPGGVAEPGTAEAWFKTWLQRDSSQPALRTMINVAGRPSVCTPGGLVSGVTPCPP